MGESISSITLLAHSAMDMQADTSSAAWLQKIYAQQQEFHRTERR
jgi:hypothetical protein